MDRLHGKGVSSRGYEGDTWRDIDQVRAALKNLPRNFLIPIRVFQAGECPNASRVYFSFLSREAADVDASSSIEYFLGQRSNLTRIQAGNQWDEMVERANRAANRRLPLLNGSLGVRAIPNPILRDHYNERLGKVWVVASAHGINPRNLKMKVKASLRKVAGIEIGFGKPDGIWLTTTLSTPKGGVFEAKLTTPLPNALARMLASYALLAEYRFNVDFDFGCLLVLEGPERLPRQVSVPITEVNRQDALANLSRAIALLSQAAAAGRRLTRSKQWSAFLTRPDVPPRIGACDDCQFVSECKPREDKLW